MWTEEHRQIYRREGGGYPSDLRDAEWARLAPLIPEASPGGRPRKTDMRAAMNAILDLLRTGCPWRYLPRDSIPPSSTVYNIFRKFQRDGVWDAIWAELYMALRERMSREASPSAAVLDSQSVKSAEKGAVKTTRWVTTRQEGERRQDPRPGRYRRTADAGDCSLCRDARPRRRGLVLDKIRRRFPWLELISADCGYNAW
jgi:putative transposase